MDEHTLEQLFRDAEIFSKYRFPLNRGKTSTGEYLKDVYKWYLGDVESSHIPADIKASIRRFCGGIVDSIDLYANSDVVGAYLNFYAMMNQLKDKLPYTYVEDTNYNSYYRVLEDREGNQYDPVNMLHVPYKKRNLASPARYSIAGVICTYMSTAESVAWYEANLPQKFHLAEFAVNETCFQKYKLLCLDLDPIRITHSLQNQINNFGRDGGSIDALTDRLALYFHVYPLVMACSITRKYTESSFTEEYLIPQMLMAWIRQDDNFLGVRYSTSSKYPDAKRYNAFNIAIPAKKLDADGFDDVLKSLFINTSAKVEYFNIKDSLNAYAEKIAEIDTFYRGALYAYTTAKVTLPYRGIFSICETILMNWNDLIGDYRHSTYSKFRTISNQRQCAANELELLQLRYGDSIDFFVSAHEAPQLTDKTKAEVRETVASFRTVVCSFLDDFDDFLSHHVFVGTRD